MEKSPLKSIVLVFSLFIAMFLGWFIVGAIGFYRAVSSQSWPTVEGTVVTSSVVRPTGKSTKYIAEVSYSYTVGNKNYTNNKLKATAARGTSQWAAGKVDEYAVNTAVTVHYHPNNPQKSLIEPGLQSDNLWMTLLPLSAIVLILFALKKQIKSRKISN